jgi:lysophospholipase L1-like esterase
MKRILCYGDSNTWGYISGSDHLRYNSNERWTKLLQKKLGQSFEIIEEGLNSRTLFSNDDRPGKEGRNGFTYLKPCMDSHDKFDTIIIMLGTNDRSKPVEEVMQKYTEILDLLRKLHPSSQIISLSLFCGERYEEQSKMVEEYNKANGTNIAFINTAGWIAPSPIHPLRQNHNIIAELLASKIREILSK